jgi:DNA-binding transcriptional LysR family regulator
VQLCSQAGFSPRIRYEARTVHGVLDLVAAGLGVALVPESIALLEPAGVRLRPLARRGGDKARTHELLGLIRRKGDANPLLPAIEAAMEEIFAALRQRVTRLMTPGTRRATGDDAMTR